MRAKTTTIEGTEPEPIRGVSNREGRPRVAIEFTTAERAAIKAIELACGHLTPTLPITLDDTAAIWDLLKPLLRGTGLLLEVTYAPSAILVSVYPGEGFAACVSRMLVPVPVP